MAEKFRLSRKKFNEVIQSKAVRKRLRARAESILPRAQRIAIAAGEQEFADSLRVETGTRPGSGSPSGIERPYARVIADMDGSAQIEHGAQGIPRRRILGQAAR